VGLWHPHAAVADDGAPATPRPVDPVGLLLLAGLLAALLALLLDSRSLGLPAGVALPVLLVALIWWEGRVPFPAVDLPLFARPAYASAVAGVLGMTVVLHATLVFVPLLVERVLNGDPLTSGLVLLGISGLSAVAAPFGGRWSDRVGRRAPAVIGSVIAAAGLGGLWLLVAPMQAAGAFALVLAVALGVVGIGFGLSGSPRQAAALESAPAGEVGMAASTYFTGRYLGGVLGAGLAGLVLNQAVTAGAISIGFAILCGVAAVVALISLGLPSRAQVAS
jgi:MFS family permease